YLPACHCVPPSFTLISTANQLRSACSAPSPLVRSSPVAVLHHPSVRNFASASPASVLFSPMPRAHALPPCSRQAAYQQQRHKTEKIFPMAMNPFGRHDDGQVPDVEEQQRVLSVVFLAPLQTDIDEQRMAATAE